MALVESKETTAASVGVAVVILTDLVLLPIRVSYVHFDSRYGERILRREAVLAPLWRKS